MLSPNVCSNKEYRGKFHLKFLQLNLLAIVLDVVIADGRGSRSCVMKHRNRLSLAANCDSDGTAQKEIKALKMHKFIQAQSFVSDEVVMLGLLARYR